MPSTHYRCGACGVLFRVPKDPYDAPDPAYCPECGDFCWYEQEIDEYTPGPQPDGPQGLRGTECDH